MHNGLSLVEVNLFDRILAIVGGIATLGTLIFGISTWIVQSKADDATRRQANMRPFLERQMAIYEATSRMAAAAAFDSGNETKINEFVVQSYGPLKTVADRRVVLAAALMRDSLAKLPGRTPTCGPDKVSYLLADCTRESIEHGWGYSLRDFGKYNYCTATNFDEQLAACGVNEADQKAMSISFRAP